MSSSDLDHIFGQIKALMTPYEHGSIKARIDTDTRYELWSEKELVADGRKRNDVYFAGLIIQSKYVGFYYMPVYIEPEMKTFFQPELLKMLKGKSCFHIKKLDGALKLQIAEALEKGYKLYEARGWV